MRIFCANLGSKFCPQLENRFFPLLRCRVYSSSVPVRYIPKKKRESQTSPPASSSHEGNDLSGSKALGPGGLRIDSNQPGMFVTEEKSWSKFCNPNGIPMTHLMYDNVEMGLSETEEEIDNGVVEYNFEGEVEVVDEDDNLFTQSHRDDHEKKVPLVFKTKQEAEQTAVELLAARAFTAVELRKKLHGKKFPSEIAEEVINDFKNRGLISDCLYAEAYSRSRWTSSTWGPRRIKQALLKKGVSEVDVEKAVTLVFKEGESVMDQESMFGLSKLSIDHLYVQASKQWLRGQNVPQETRKSRIIRWLQYRGFNWNVINFILKKLESQYPP